MDDVILSEYEIRRKRQMEENEKYLASLESSHGTSDIPATSVRKKRAALSRTLSRTRVDNQCISEAGDVEQAFSPKAETASINLRAGTRRIKPESAPNRAVGIQEKPTFEAGQLVWSRYTKIEGQRLWPAKVHTQNGDMITVEWENPDGHPPMFETHYSELRERPVCGCGECTAQVLTDDKALLEHNIKVTCCKNFSDSSQNCR